MKICFAAIFLLLIMLSIIAWSIQPRDAETDKLALSWVSDDNPARREQIELFNKLHPDLKLLLDPNNGGTQKVIVQCLAGVGPDLFDCYSVPDLEAFVKSGVAMDVTAELTKAGIDVKRDVWPVGQNAVIHKNRTYGFPTNVVAQALWINKDIFKSCGVPIPKGEWTWEEFIPVAQRLTKRDKNGRIVHYGLLLEWGYWAQFVWQWGGSVYTRDGTRCVVDSPQAIAGIKFLRDLIYKYKVMPSPVDEATMATSGGWGSGSITWFGAGKSAMAYGGRWWLCSLRGYENLRLSAVECPHGPVRVYFGGARATLVNKNNPRCKEALEFLKYMGRKHYNELINHQADGLAPVKSYSFTDKYLHDPQYPHEDFNAVWRDAMDYTRPMEVTPFINAMAANRILTKQLDLIKNDQKTVEAALKTAAREINAEIQRSVKKDPELMKEYERLTGRKVQ